MTTPAAQPPPGSTRMSGGESRAQQQVSNVYPQIRAGVHSLPQDTAIDAWLKEAQEHERIR